MYYSRVSFPVVLSVYLYAGEAVPRGEVGVGVDELLDARTRNLGGPGSSPLFDH